MFQWKWKFPMLWPPRRRRPIQLYLPFWCGHYNDTCEYVRDPNMTGFNCARCWKCGIDYEPVCDR